MALTLEITPELEHDLREAAEKAGVAPDAYVVALLRREFKRRSASHEKGNRLPPDEAALLKQINQSLSRFGWQRYCDLLAKRQAATLTPAEIYETISCLQKSLVLDTPNRAFDFLGFPASGFGYFRLPDWRNSQIFTYFLCKTVINFVMARNG